jgi:hypothetical protein
MPKKDPNEQYRKYVIRKPNGIPDFLPVVPMPKVKPPRQDDDFVNYDRDLMLINGKRSAEHTNK